MFKTINQFRTKLREMPKRVWWIGGISIAFIYCFLLYLFLVAPSGFRWRAIYGDPEYPDGYEIHGIDISHHQGNVNWGRLRNALIELAGGDVDGRVAISGLSLSADDRALTVNGQLDALGGVGLAGVTFVSQLHVDALSAGVELSDLRNLLLHVFPEIRVNLGIAFLGISIKCLQLMLAVIVVLYIFLIRIIALL